MLNTFVRHKLNIIASNSYMFVMLRSYTTPKFLTIMNHVTATIPWKVKSVTTVKPKPH